MVMLKTLQIGDKITHPIYSTKYYYISNFGMSTVYLKNCLMPSDIIELSYESLVYKV